MYTFTFWKPRRRKVLFHNRKYGNYLYEWHISRVLYLNVVMADGKKVMRYCMLHGMEPVRRFHPGMKF